jgi:hypothetical protein
MVGNLPAVRYLIENGAELDRPSAGLMRTPLAAAIAGRQSEVALYLIDAGARCDESLRFDSQGGAPVSVMAARYDLPEVYLALVRRGVLEGTGTTALARAMKHGLSKVVSACLADPVLCQPAQGAELDRALVDGASEEAVALLLSWRTDHMVARALGACAARHVARDERLHSASQAPL